MEFLFSRDEKPENHELLAKLREKLESPDGELEFANNDQMYGFFKSDTGCVAAFDIIKNEEDGMMDVFYVVLSSEVHLFPALKTNNFDELRY